MENTHFVTPSGLDAEDHYSTAADMALLTACALENEDFAEICSTSQAQVQFGNPPYDRWLTNNNRLLTRYEGAIGVKTGYTGNARRCLVSAAQRNGVTLICVTLNCADDWNIHETLYDRYFARLEQVELWPEEEPYLSVAGGEALSVEAVPSGRTSLALTEEEQERMETALSLRPVEFAPVGSGRPIGSLVCRLDGETVLETPIVAAASVPAREVLEQSLLDKLKSFIIELF